VRAPDRPVVYLDQRHWITLAQRLHSPDEVAERDREPAERLIELARSKLIALPLSSANLWEIAPTGPHRRDVALTMVELSRGWQTEGSGQRPWAGVEAVDVGAESSARGSRDHSGTGRDL
jgi:hypothetical protein